MLADKAREEHRRLQAEITKRRNERVTAVDRQIIRLRIPLLFDIEESAIEDLRVTNIVQWGSSWKFKVENIPFEVKLRLIRKAGGPGEASTSDTLAVTEFQVYMKVAWRSFFRSRTSRIRIKSLADLGAALAYD